MPECQLWKDPSLNLPWVSSPLQLGSEKGSELLRVTRICGKSRIGPRVGTSNSNTTSDGSYSVSKLCTAIKLVARSSTTNNI